MPSDKRPKVRTFSDRPTLDGPWEWAFDRMLAKKKAADAAAARPAKSKRLTARPK
jgi:hypothetical protein